MPTTLKLQRKQDDGTLKPISFTYDGASPDDAGPRGVLVKFVTAMATNDVELAQSMMTQKSREMPRGGSGPQGDVAVTFGPSEPSGEFTVIPAELNADGQGITLPVHMVREQGEWRVDMATTMDKLMGGLMEAMGGMMEQAMGGLAEGIGKAMEGMGEVMRGAFEEAGASEQGGEGGQGGEASVGSDPHPMVQSFRDRMGDRLGLFQDVTIDWPAFEAEHARLAERHGPGPDMAEDVVRGALDEMLGGVGDFAVEDSPARQTLVEKVARFHLTRGEERAAAYDPATRTLTLTVGENMAGGPDFYGREEVFGAIWGALPEVA